jgi:hypothetical protein
MQDTSCWPFKGKTANCKTLEKKALKYICNLFEITCPTWEEYLKLQKKKRPKVAPAECQTTVNPTTDLPTFSNKEAGANPNAGGISAPPPVPPYHTVRFNFLEIAAKQRAGTATTTRTSSTSGCFRCTGCSNSRHGCSTSYKSTAL